MEQLQAMNSSVLIVIGLIWILEIALMVWALIDIVRRPVHEIRWGKKWLWVLIALFINLAGPIIYLAVGRVVHPMAKNGDHELDRENTAAAIDTLYHRNVDQ